MIKRDEGGKHGEMEMSWHNIRCDINHAWAAIEELQHLIGPRQENVYCWAEWPEAAAKDEEIRRLNERVHAAETTCCQAVDDSLAGRKKIKELEAKLSDLIAAVEKFSPVLEGSLHKDWVAVLSALRKAKGE